METGKNERRCLNNRQVQGTAGLQCDTAPGICALLVRSVYYNNCQQTITGCKLENNNLLNFLLRPL